MTEQGAGTALMTAAEECARGNDAVLISLDTYLHSPLSVPFYEQRMGYRRQAIAFRKELVRPVDLEYWPVCAGPSTLRNSCTKTPG